MHDDHACLEALKVLWQRAKVRVNKRASIFRIGVTLPDIVSSEHRQLDLLMDDDRECQRWEAILGASLALSSRSLAHVGRLTPDEFALLQTMDFETAMRSK